MVQNYQFLFSSRVQNIPKREQIICPCFYFIFLRKRCNWKFKIRLFSYAASSVAPAILITTRVILVSSPYVHSKRIPASQNSSTSKRHANPPIFSCVFNLFYFKMKYRMKLHCSCFRCFVSLCTLDYLMCCSPPTKQLNPTAEIKKKNASNNFRKHRVVATLLYLSWHKVITGLMYYDKQTSWYLFMKFCRLFCWIG